MGFWADFVVAVLATWRITYLLAREDGPGAVLARFRARLRPPWAELMDCFHCLSLWVAAPIALAVAPSWWNWPLIWLALSGAACLVQRLGGEPVLIQHVPEMEGESNGMLRPMAGHAPPGGTADGD